MAPELRKYKSSIFRNGLLFVLLPISIGSALLLSVGQLWSRAETNTTNEHSQTQKVEELNQLFKKWGFTTSLAFRDVVEKDLAEKITDRHSHVWWSFYQLKQSCENDANATAKIVHLEKLYEQELAAFAQLPKAEDDLTLKLAQELPKSLAQIYKVRSEVKDYLIAELAELKHRRHQERDSLETLKLFVAGFALCNLSFAVILVWFFSRSVSSRIRILGRNAQLLARKQPILDHLTGNDEFVYLDEVISKTANEIKQADESSAAIYRMLTHDMRSPLMAAQISLQMIQEIGGAYPEGCYELLEDSETLILSILENVNQLLSLEKKADLEQTTALSENSGSSARVETIAMPSERKTVSVHLKDFFLRPKIFQKGLWITLLPLVFQIAFLSYIFHQIQVVQSLASEEARCVDLNIASNIVAMDLARGAAAQGIYILTSEQRAKKLAVEALSGAVSNYSAMSQLAGNDSLWLEYIRLARDLTDSQAQQMLAVGPESPTSDKYKAFLEISEQKEKNDSAFRVRKLGKELFERNYEQLQSMEEAQADLANLIRSIILGAIAVNFSVAVLMLHVFSKNIKARIDLLVLNAQRIAKKEAILETVSGTDEISYLGEILKQSQDNLNHSAKLRAEMLGSIAVKIKVPLQAAEAKLGEFKELAKGQLKSEPQKHTSMAFLNIQRVLQFVEELLTLKQESCSSLNLQKKSFCLASLSEKSIQRVHSLAQQKHVTIELSVEPICLVGDEEKLEQVLVNYLSNAIKFSPDFSKIEVSSTIVNGLINVAVKDQGQGISPEDAPRIFEEFFQSDTTNKSKGFGIGLSICKSIIEAHGGKVGVTAEGAGSRFWFELPLVIDSGP